MMNIELLNMLKDNPNHGTYSIEGISLTEISTLEELYNGANPFPKVLKEMLYLAGRYCTVLDFNIYESQQEMQDEERVELDEFHQISIVRPFYFVDLRSYGSPCFIYLDEGDNPLLQQVVNINLMAEIVQQSFTLKDAIEIGINNILTGYPVY